MTLHPLVERIIRIHVAEEARHLSFARHYLRRRIPRVGWIRRQIVGIAIPIILGIMARQMLAPSSSMIRRFKIPSDVIDEVYRNNPAAGAEVSDSLDKVRDLAYELKLINRVNRPIWKAFRIWKPPVEVGRVTTERRVDSRGVSLLVREHGDPAAPTVVLVHGFPDTSRLWDEVVERLQGRYHVVTYDVRGMGRSTRRGGRPATRWSASPGT